MIRSVAFLVEDKALFDDVLTNVLAAFPPGSRLINVLPYDRSGGILPTNGSPSYLAVCDVPEAKPAEPLDAEFAVVPPNAEAIAEEVGELLDAEFTKWFGKISANSALSDLRRRIELRLQERLTASSTASRDLLARAVSLLRGDLANDTRAGLADAIEEFLSNRRPKRDSVISQRIDRILEAAYGFPGSTEAIRKAEENFEMSVERLVDDPDCWVSLSRYTMGEGANASNYLVFERKLLEGLRIAWTNHREYMKRLRTQVFDQPDRLDERTKSLLDKVFRDLSDLCNKPTLLPAAPAIIRQAADLIGEHLESYADPPREGWGAEAADSHREIRSKGLFGTKAERPRTLLQAARAVARAYKGIVGSPQYVAVHQQVMEDLREAIERQVRGGAVSALPEPPTEPLRLGSLLYALRALIAEDIRPSAWRSHIKEAVDAQFAFVQSGGCGEQAKSSLSPTP